jgi:hypothetical protein
MTAQTEQDMRELRQQMTVFLMAGGLSLGLLEGSRRMVAHPEMSTWLRHGAISVLLLGCGVAGISMLVTGVADLRRAAKQATEAAPAHRKVNRGKALVSVAFGGLLGLLVPGALLIQALRG